MVIETRSADRCLDHAHRLVATPAPSLGPVDAWARDAGWAMVALSGLRFDPATTAMLDAVVRRAAHRELDLRTPARQRDHGWLCWGLGAACLAPHPTTRLTALQALGRCVERGSADLRANALVALGAASAIRAYPGAEVPALLLERSVRALVPPRPDEAWPWPEQRLGEANALVPAAMLDAAAVSGDVALLGAGLRLLRWLVGIEHAGTHFSFTPRQGRGPDDPVPAFDQEAVQAGAMTTACATAFRLTGDLHWARAARRSAAWFTGANDLGVSLVDQWGGHEVAAALTASGPSREHSSAAWFAARVAAARAGDLTAGTRHNRSRRRPHPRPGPVIRLR